MYKSNKKFDELISKMLKTCEKEGYIPSYELASILNKDHKAVTRDIREELYRMDMYEIDTSEMFVPDWEKDYRNRPRKVYYLSGLALTQLISRWDPLIRFMINTIIHNIQDRMQTYGIRSYNLTDFNDDLRELMNRAFELNLAYTSLMNETKYPHIKENYKSIIDKIEELKNEALSLKKKREDRYPKIIQIAEEIRRIDAEHANFMGQLEKENEYEDKEMAKHAIENQ